MFDIQVKLKVILADCPEDGLAAIDFRRQYGIPDAPSNMVALEFVSDGEDLCRAAARYLNRSADLIILGEGKNGSADPREQVPSYTASPAARALVSPISNEYGGGRRGAYAVPTAPVGAFLRDPDEGLIDLIDALAQAAATDELARSARPSK
jgi:hypothetical protein